LKYKEIFALNQDGNYKYRKGREQYCKFTLIEMKRAVMLYLSDIIVYAGVCYV